MSWVLYLFVYKRIHSGCERPQDVEATKDDNGQEQSIVVEDGIGGSLIVSHFILFP